MIVRRRSRFFAVTLLLLSLPTLAQAAKIRLDVNTERPDALYKMGEEVKFLITATADGKPITPGQVEVKYVLNEDGLNTLKEGTLELGPEPTAVVGCMDKPGFLKCSVAYTAEAKSGQKASSIWAYAGAAISPELITPSMPVPDDFDAFWADQKKKLAALPMKSKLTPVNSRSEKMECFDVQVNCPGGAPVSAYLGRPKGAKPKSLPAVLWVHGAGVRSSNLNNAKKAERLGMLSMDLNAHGIPNGKPAGYYKDRYATDLKSYAFQGNEDRETCYFKGMLLRLQRAMDFLTSQPEWDGKTLIVVGSSQGGAQALVAGGLDPRVSFIGTGVPAMCDHTGMVIDRIAGWPKFVPVANGKPDPEALQTSRYIDAVNFASRYKGEAIMTVGFIDATCPPTTCYAAYNQLQGKKQVIHESKMGHSHPKHLHEAFENAFLSHAKAMAEK